jgi:hypothetical protein
MVPAWVLRGKRCRRVEYELEPESGLLGPNGRLKLVIGCGRVKRLIEEVESAARNESVGVF